jgi:hypothetical protein
MRFRLVAAVLLGCLAAAAQQTLSVEQLASFLRSSVQMMKQGKMTDKEVANFLGRVKLSQRLDDRTVEEMQGFGIGPKTTQALQMLRDHSQMLAAAKPLAAVLPPKPIPPPTSEEQAAVIDDMREYALGYSKNLPDFICTQVTRRFAAAAPGTRYGGAAGGNPSWQKLDELTIRLSYFGQKEDYKLILVNSTPASQDYKNLGGSTSYGDFGSMLKEIFEPGTQARFEWDHWGTLRGQRVMAFSYHVEQSRSQWHILVKDAGLDIVPAYHGLVEVDKDSHAVLRVTLEAENMPASFPVKRAKSILDYDYQDISGRTFLLPLKGQVEMDGGDYLTLNILEFHMYRKYSAESEIKYDADTTAAPPPIPEDKTKETPDTKAPVQKK